MEKTELGELVGTQGVCSVQTAHSLCGAAMNPMQFMDVPTQDDAMLDPRL